MWTKLAESHWINLRVPLGFGSPHHTGPKMLSSRYCVRACDAGCTRFSLLIQCTACHVPTVPDSLFLQTADGSVDSSSFFLLGEIEITFNISESIGMSHVCVVLCCDWCQFEWNEVNRIDIIHFVCTYVLQLNANWTRHKFKCVNRLNFILASLRAFDVNAKYVKTWKHSTNGCFLFHFYSSRLPCFFLLGLCRGYIRPSRKMHSKKIAFKFMCCCCLLLQSLAVFTFWKK